MPHLPDRLEFENKETFANALADAVSEAIVSAQGRFLLGVSGGSTPIPVYERLSARDLPWDRVDIALVDERFVPPGDPASNESAVRASLYKDQAAKAGFIGLWSDCDAPDLAAEKADAAITNLSRPFDLVLLGMGADGHFASIFPGAAQLAEALDLSSDKKVMALTPAIMPEHAPHPRLTLTLAEIARAKRIILAINGDKKLEILQTAFAARDERAYPVAALFQPSLPSVEIYWSP